jgi:hypothetical protein
MERSKTETEGKQNMKLVELIIVGAFTVLLIFALADCNFEAITSFNPVQWISNSINGFLNMLKTLFFGWMP